MRARAALLAAALLLSGCGGDPTAVATQPRTLTVSGTLTVKGTYPAVSTVDEITCTTGGGYTDIRQGTQVVVTDESARTIALGRLGYGSWERREGCIFLFMVADIPAGQRFYGIEVGHRGRLQYTAAQLATPLALTIGD